MKPIAIVNPDFDNYLSIRYGFTNVCNYSCSYCWPDSHAGTTKWPDFDLICKNFDHLITVYKTYFNKKSIRFHLIGGEDLQDAMKSYANVFPEKTLDSVYLLVYQNEEYEDE
jgi:sulfatase maturation enzyme AslB (radical SAM superfamily)